MAGNELEQEKKPESKQKHRVKSYLPESTFQSGYITRSSDPSVRGSKSSDAAHFPGGTTPEVVRILPNATTAEVAQVVKDAVKILPIGAQSSLTGGATPDGSVILDISSQERILSLAKDTVTVQAGVVLRNLQERLQTKDLFYPPVPTYDGATVGGVIATNAAGANTFKYGQTREWVKRLTVVLANGEVLDIKRGNYIAHRPDMDHAYSYFELENSKGEVKTIPIPTYKMPNVPKLSAGYYAQPKMDFIDLFIGSEGTLGVITQAELKVIAKPQTAWALIPCKGAEQALAITKDLRQLHSSNTRRKKEKSTLDLSAIEYIDENSLNLVRNAGKWAPKNAQTVLLAQIEMTKEQAANSYNDLSEVFENPDTAPDVPITRFAKVLQKHGVLDDNELGIAMAGETNTIDKFKALRESVPEIVNKINHDRHVQKNAGDMIVPLDQLADMMRLFDKKLKDFDYAVWGHISDGNLHPNILVRSEEEVDRAKRILNNCGRRVIRMGGSPLAEHGIGRNPGKQYLLKALYGKIGIDQMRVVKKMFDPEGKLAPGNLFPILNQTRRTKAE